MRGREIIVKVADRAVGVESDVLITLGLGSCVAVLMHDPVHRIGGLAHVLLPDPGFASDRSNLSKFASTALPVLLDEIEEQGGNRGAVTARLAGGASMFGSLMTSRSMNMGAKNVDMCRRVVKDLGLPITGEVVGGDHGRSVHFDVASGEVRIAAALRDDVFL